jgi:hypothetical protein
VFRALIRLLRRGSIADPSQLTLSLDDRQREPLPTSVRGPIQNPSPARAPVQPAPAGRRRRRATPAEADAAAGAKLVKHHAEYNASRFGGRLKPITITVSPRLRSRLGYYRVATAEDPGLIVISRRHLRRHGWAEVLETLLHEMVHQWQDESHLPVDHGAGFRAQARAVGILPRARRPVDPPSPTGVPGVGPAAPMIRGRKAARRDRRNPGP